MRLLILTIIPIFLLARSYTLPELISKAQRHHQQLKAKNLSIKSVDSQIESIKNSFYPTIDISAQYIEVTPNSVVFPEGTARGAISINYDIYDGGRKDAMLTAKQFEWRATQFERDSFNKSIILDITNRYFSIYKFKSNLNALRGQSEELIAQIDRIKKFYINGLATQEEIDKLQAVYENNQYLVANANMRLITQIENIRLSTGLKVDNLKESRYLEPRNIIYEKYEISKNISAKANAIEENAKAIDSGYMPQVVVSDTYHHSSYNGVKSNGFGDELLIEDENRLNLSVNMRVFDNGKMEKDSEALRYQKLSLKSNAIYEEERQEMQFRLAKSRLVTLKKKQQSTKSALKATRSTYTSIVKKFDIGAVDNITYLDALNKLTLATAKDKETLYDYEIAKSIYYYYAGKNPKEFIR
ncbi:MAG: TolC family protein [Sulfurovum sp.]|nr:TolC family protein [Sulfurovaceae bacterium]